jgi:hypothetical protein
MVTITYEVVLVDVDDEKLWSEGHLIRRWFEGIDNELEVAIKAEAPASNEPGGTKRWPLRTNMRGHQPGALRRGIRSTEPLRTGPRALETKIVSEAAHTKYVLFGTSPNIYARQAGGLFGFKALGFALPAQGWIGFKRVQRVSGQEPNNFFQRGYDIVAANHSSLR